MAEPPASDYRARIYGRYMETHLSAVTRPPTRAIFAYEAKVFRKTFGPLLPESRTAAVFEAGCGAGSFLYYLVEEGYSKACGMDVSASAVETALALGVRGASRGDALEHLKNARSSYDCVVAIDVVEHLKKEELFGFLEAVLGALKPGGSFIWRSPNADGPFFGRIRYGDLTHELAFTRHSAFQLMAAAGFVDAEISGEVPVVTGARSLLRAVLWKGFSALARLYLYAESCDTGALLAANLLVRARKPR